MIIKVEYRNLCILNEEDTVEKAIRQYEMRHNYKKVTQFVVDNKGCLIGLLGMSDIKDLSDADLSKGVSEVMNRHFIKIILKEGEEERDKNGLAVRLTDHYFSVPVVNEEGKLLFAYEKANERINYYLSVMQPRFSFASVQLYSCIVEKTIKGKVYICSNLGNADNLVEIDGISGLKKEDAVIIGFDEDYLAQKAIDNCMQFSIPYYAHIDKDINDRFTDYARTNPVAKTVFDEIIQENGTYFDWRDFETIFQMLEQTRKLGGCYVEIGTYRGDSARAALEYMKQAGIKRQAYFLDTYEGFNYLEASSSQDALWKGTHSDTSKELVEYRLRNYENFKCIRSNIITNDIPEEIGSIALCNIDVDIYEAYEAALEKVRLRLSSGGVILAEDFAHTPSLIGGYHAISKFAQKYKDEFFVIYGRGSQLILYKK
ncbi:MAG: class I SAM-dependent methyltransferase [Lachnospiraceae bacterium]|nr:class I SAM-dependent methyltransferase [Lachnospiraceae bacterium]